ncbi:hypothetical protein AVEN_125165-1 [Araneus ventricosus]|uniref:Uncharacterized protein n=1 Tax=Araneus ventricosus TaxID=182803 RepID=A0A4Y2LU53_ARAVE|nr:hypothetical protein AVEN_125165-1 [Araneus ventricosus]
MATPGKRYGSSIISNIGGIKRRSFDVRVAVPILQTKQKALKYVICGNCKAHLVDCLGAAWSVLFNEGGMDFPEAELFVEARRGDDAR